MSDRHLVQIHVHECGHRCGCARPEAARCVQEEIEARGPEHAAEVWAERWPDHRPHPRYDLVDGRPVDAHGRPQ